MLNTVPEPYSKYYRNRIGKIVNWEEFWEIFEEVIMGQDLGDKCDFAGQRRKLLQETDLND